MLKRRRRRIVQVVDSSTEDDVDVSNNNKSPLQPPDSKLDDRNNIPQSVVTADRTQHKETFPYVTSNRQHSHYAEFTASERCCSTGSGQPGSTVRSQPPVQSEHPAEYSRSSHTALSGSGKPFFVNRTDLSLPSKAMPPVEIVESSDRAKSVDNIKLLNANGRDLSSFTAIGTKLPAGMSDVPTFSLGFDEFLNSENEDEDDIIVDKVTEFTEIKPLKDRISALEKPSIDSRSVLVSSQDVGLYRSGQTGLIGSRQQNLIAAEQCKTITSRLSSQSVPQSGFKCGSDQPRLNGSGQFNSLLRSAPAMSCSPVVSQLDCVTVSSQHELSGSGQPSCINSSACSEAERLREERIRLSRLKKEEFQRKFANNSSSQPRTVSPAVGSTAGAGNVVDVPQTKRRILVDSRELSGAQVT